MRRLFVLVLLLGGVATLPAQDIRLPMKDGSVKFAVIGDTGTGDSHQLDVAKQLNYYRSKFQFPFVLMMGDNLYSGDAPKDYQKEFERPYKPLLDVGVKFYASLGNHDNPNERLYKPFNMNGERYYTFKPAGSSVRFFALDRNYMDDKQLAWLEDDLKGRSTSQPIVVFAHIPLWSVYPDWGWGTEDAAQALGYLKRFGSVTVLNGHIHQVMQKVEGNVTFHTARSTAFPQPAPGTAPSPGPLKVPEEKLRSLLGTANVTFKQNEQRLAIIDTTLQA